MRELALFAGAGGGILGGVLLGWRTVCAVEIDAYARRVLLARQRDGCLEPFPVWDDIRTFDGKPWRGHVEIVTGGFPCQDISTAGKGAGITGERSGLWKEMARVIGEVRPSFALVENSPALTSRGLGIVLGDLAEMGYDARWGVLGAVHAGAPHRRERIWIVAYHKHDGWHESEVRRSAGTCQDKGRVFKSQGRDPSSNALANAPELQRNGGDHHAGSSGESWRKVSELGNGGCATPLANPTSLGRSETTERLEPGQPVPVVGGETSGDVADAMWDGLERIEQTGSETRPTDRSVNGCDRGWWRVEPDMGRVAHGVAHRVDRLRCLGNGQVPAVVRIAWETLTDR